MDESLTLPPVSPLDDVGSQHVTPFSADDMALAETKIVALGTSVDTPPERLRTRMNQEGQAPREGMGFVENFSGQFKSGTLLGAISEDIDIRQAKWASSPERKRLEAQSSAGGYEGSVAKKALQTKDRMFKDQAGAEDAVFQQAAYDLSQSNMSGASVAGALVAGVLAPENFLITLPVKAQVAVGQFIANRLPSARPAIQAALVSGVDAAFGNVVTDPAVQAIRMGSGAQGEYDVAQTALAAPVGFAAGAALRGAVGAATGEFKAKAGDVASPPARPASDASLQSMAASANDRIVDPTLPATPPALPARLIGVEPRRMAAHSVATADGGKVDVAPIVVDASTLRASSDAGYDASIQPRDRTRAASDAQIREIAATLDPERLGMSAEADRGAPIVGPDAMVESGNGRISAIRQAYAQGGESAAKYRAWVESLGVDTAGMKEPVLVRQRLTDMTPGERQKFAVSANQSATLSMSAPERAKADAGALSPTALDLIRNPDDFGGAANRDFLRAFAQALPVSERGTFMAADGSVSAEGLSRARNAVLARAYEDPAILARITESTDDDIKSISGALVSVAPEWAKFRAEIDAGTVRADVDQTKQLLEAVSRTADIRAKGMSLDMFFRQQDAFDVISPEVQGWMAMFYRQDGKRAAGKDSISERLRYYAQEARKVSADDGLFSDMPVVRVSDLQGAAATKGIKDAGTETQTGLFDASKNGSGGNAQALRTEGQGQAAGSGGGTPDVLALGQQPRRGAKAAIERIKNGEPVKPDAAPDVLPMAQRPAMPGTADTPFMRQILDGETQKPVTMPRDAGPEEVHAFRVTEAIADLAAQLGRKVEMDGRFTARGAAGEYKIKDGVIRLRQAGDFETFAHEAGHAIDQDLARTVGNDWNSLLKSFEKEVAALDTNVSDPAAKTLKEGTAEFLRAYVTNPAYAQKQMAPQFFEAFERFIAEKAPGMQEWFASARRASQIDSGMLPTQRMEAMQVSQIEPGKWAAFRETWKREGLPIAFRDVWDQFNTAVIGKDQPVYRTVELLKEARYEKTGLPMPKEYTWDDPYKRFRQLPGVEQGALDMIWHGVRPYGSAAPNIQRVSVSLHDSIKLAIGSVSKISDPEDPAVKAFNGYLIARRSVALYDRFASGDLRNPPVRASRAEVIRAVADYEAANPQYRQAADGVFQWARAMLERKRDAGLISQDVFDAIIAKSPTGEYVPFYRDVSDLKGGGGKPGDGLERSSVKTIGGSTRDILDPMQSLFMDGIRTERLIARNDFVKSLHLLAQQGGELGGRFVERIPNSELKAQSIDLADAFRSKAKELGMEKADAEIILRQMEELIGDDMSATVFRATDTTTRGERVMFYWDGGERVALKTGNDRYSKQMFDLMADMGSAERDLLVGMFGKANTYFTQFITNAPQFALKNIVMDNLSRVFIGRNTGAVGRIPFASVAQGVYTTIFDREFSKAYEALGGLRGGVAASAVRELTPTEGFAGAAMKPLTFKEAGAEFVRDQGSWGNLTYKVVASPVSAIKAIVHAVEATETIGRVGQAKIVYNHLKKQGLTDAEAMRGALFETRDILDYDRFGTSTTALRRLLPFTNVAFQGTSRANQNLITDSARAVMQWNQRGRDWAKVDPQLQTAFMDGLMNWGMIAAGIAATAGYHAAMAESDVYNKASDYMKRRYWLIPVPGADASGDQNYISIPKPFDLPGAMISAFEATLEAQRKVDPEGWKKSAAALRDGFVPRQFESLEAFLSSQPQLKLVAEMSTGKTIPFDGGKSREIVPQSLRSLPPEQQFTGNTSWLGKKVGEAMGVSPIKVDHVFTSMTATAGRDVNDALTAAFGDNPNMTNQDAWTKMFFGGLYRRQRGIGEPGNGIREAMGADGGKYVIAANGYRRALETGDKPEADRRFNQADNITKSVMVFRGHDFAPAERQLHPLERAEKIAEIGGKFSRDLSMSRVEVLDRSRRRGSEREYITVDQPTARALTTAINAMVAEDIASGLKIANVPGYANAKVIDTSERLNYIKALSKEVGEELEDRIKAAHIQPIDHVEKNWPEVQRRLLQDRDGAKFGDLLPGVKLPKKRK